MEMLNVEGGAGGEARGTTTARRPSSTHLGDRRRLLRGGPWHRAADLVGGSREIRQGARAMELTKALKKRMLVLHGTSCLDNDQVRGLAGDGVGSPSTCGPRIARARPASTRAENPRKSAWTTCARACSTPCEAQPVHPRQRRQGRRHHGRDDGAVSATPTGRGKPMKSAGAVIPRPGLSSFPATCAPGNVSFTGPKAGGRNVPLNQ